MKHHVRPRLFFVLIGLLGFLVNGTAQNLAEDVLRGQEIQGVAFRNYVGPHKVIESRAAIQGIGTELGSSIGTGASVGTYGEKYRIERLFDGQSPLLSADLLSLGPTAGVDHIRNLNWIISAYLQKALAYSVDDADLLADFITRYNAFYRAKSDYFGTTYAPLVVAALKPGTSAGLALDYREWPGKTLLLIPLRNSLSKGPAGSVNTEEISNKEIIADLGNSDAALEVRKQLADLKEGEIVQEQKAIAEKEAQLEAAAAPTQSGQTPKTDASDPQTSTATGADDKQTPAVDEKTVAAAKVEVAQRDQALQAERKDIVAQETKKPAETPAVAVSKPGNPVTVLAVTQATSLGQLVLVDPQTNKVYKRSELNTIRMARFQPLGDGFLVVAGDTKGNGAVRLVLLGKDDLSVLVTGADDVSPDVAPILAGTQILGLTKGEKNAWVLGLFDSKLKLIAKGTDALQSSTAITVASNGIYVQATGGAFILLDGQTLKKKADTEG